jgi:hypothetical protein
LQVFRESKSTDTCRRVPLRVGPVVVNIVVNRFRRLFSMFLEWSREDLAP